MLTVHLNVPEIKFSTTTFISDTLPSESPLHKFLASVVPNGRRIRAEEHSRKLGTLRTHRWSPGASVGPISDPRHALPRQSAPLDNRYRNAAGCELTASPYRADCHATPATPRRSHNHIPIKYITPKIVRRPGTLTRREKPVRG